MGLGCGKWNYDELERLVEGNTTFIEAVKDVARYEHGFYNVKVYQIQKSLTLIPESESNPRKIVVVFDCNIQIKAIIGTVGGNWVHQLSMEKPLAEVLFVAISS